MKDRWWKMTDFLIDKLPWLLPLAVLVGIVCFQVFSAYMEAQTYNRVTGSNVSTWEALWVELRIQEGVKE